MSNIVGQEILDNIQERTHVFQATHDGKGESLSHLSRSFISFTFGEKAIEDFGLIVTNSDRMEREIYTPFSDVTSSYDTLNGQLYWGTKYEPNHLKLTLSTDEMSEQQLDNFREWFAPGENRELVLAEHPNRAIMARVSEPPTISMLPFEKQIEINWPGAGKLTTSTTIYKGDISINFVMDEPIWYAKLNYMPTYVNKYTLKETSLDDLDKIITLSDRETQKIMYEDGIPHQSVLEGDSISTFFLGGNILVTEKSLVGVAKVGQSHIGIITTESEGLEVNLNTPQYLFYSGTAISYPLIKFTLSLTFDNEKGYINCPKNKIAGDTEYSYIAIDDNKMKFTTPSLLTGYNQILYIINNASENVTVTELKEAIIENVKEYYSRAWAIKCLDSYEDQALDKVTLKEKIRSFFEKDNPTVTFMIDSKTGEARGIFKINTTLNSESENSSNAQQEEEENSESGNNYLTLTQNIGDMICSDYLTIKGRNSLNDDFTIAMNNCHKITSSESLINVLVFFKNMYL